MACGVAFDRAAYLAGRIPGVRTARDIAMPPGRGIWKLAAHPRMDRLGLLRRNRPSFTLLQF